MKSYLLSLLLALLLPVVMCAQENIEPAYATDHELPSTPSSLDEELVEDHDDHFEHHHNAAPTHDSHPYHAHGSSWSEHLSPETESFEAKFFNMLLILGLLIGFMMLASWALKRMMKSKVTQLNTAGSIKVLETRYLSPRATLYLIEINNQNVLIAESPTAVTFLKTFHVSEDH